MSVALHNAIAKARRVCKCGHVHYAARCHICKGHDDDAALGIGAADRPALPLPPVHDSRRLDESPSGRCLLEALAILGAAGIAAAIGAAIGFALRVVERILA